MIDDVIKLISSTYETDEEGNQNPVDVERTVFCRVGSVTRTEFYQAAQVDMHPTFVFILSDYRDYRGEKQLKYKDWSGYEQIYDVTRVYKQPDGDSLELTAEERVGNGKD